MDPKPSVNPATPLDRARFISEAIFQQTGFRPRYVMVDGAKIDTHQDASVPLQSIFPGFGTERRR